MAGLTCVDQVTQTLTFYLGKSTMLIALGRECGVLEKECVLLLREWAASLGRVEKNGCGFLNKSPSVHVVQAFLERLLPVWVHGELLFKKASDQ